ncbi:MAG: SBBP repeat-containing protein, partial [candidate division WOR-3 bacterium]|nr:SBBP repeat-containing protein [candidate division WOR-3 bacterium]
MLQLRILRAIFLLLLVFPILLFAQIEQWVARYNGPVNGLDRGSAIAIDSQGNVYVTGYANQDPFASRSDMLTIKYNSAGQEEWSRIYGAPGYIYDEAKAIAVDNNGNVYVTGCVRGFFNDSSYIGTVKYNAQGILQWVSEYGPIIFGYGMKVAVDNQGNVYVTGTDGITIKYDSLGQEVWVARYTGIADVLFSDIKIREGYIFVTGYGGFLRCLTIKYDSLGQEQWAARYDGIEAAQGYALAVDEKGNVYVTGAEWREVWNIDYLTIKYDSTGQEQWVRRYNGPGNYQDCAFEIEVDSNSNVYVTGISAYYNRPYGDYLTIKYDSTGREIWTARYNGPWSHSDDLPYGGLALDNSGNVYVTGVCINDYGSASTSYYSTIRYGSEGEEQWVALYYYDPLPDWWNWNYAYDIAVDKAGYAYVTGEAGGPDYDCVTIKYSTYIWTRTRPMPEGLRKKKIKDGGSLVVVPDSLIFAFKGNKTNEFYAFDITNQTWTPKCSLPTVTAKKLVKKGAALTYGNGIIYATRGNKTFEFWAYYVNGDSWKRLKDVPSGSDISLKGGTGLAFVNKADSDFVYLLKGSKTNEFWVYYSNQDTWLKRKDAPILPSEKCYKDGSCIVYDGNNTIYALKSKTNEFYAYDINADVWTEKQTLPIIGNSGKKKKVKNGGAMVFADSTIYAIKGGNTLEFWQYLPGSNT